MSRLAFRLVLLCAAIAALVSVGGAGARPDSSTGAATSAVSTTIVISQVYGGGGNTGAPLQSDFVELFNRGTLPQPVDGWSIQYASATGTGNLGGAANTISELSGSIPAGGYLLVQEAGGANGAALPPADVTDPATPINMSATAGKVALVRDATPLGCNTAATCDAAAQARIVDLVGYGSANFFETAAAPAGSNTLAVLRAGGGCTDTDDNSADFATGAPTPRNGQRPPAPCGGGGDAPPSVASTSPSNGATGVAETVAPTVTFSEAVTPDAGAFGVSCTASGAHTVTVSGGPTTFTIRATPDFTPAESCTVTVTGSKIHDQDGTADAMAADYAFTFTVAAPVTLTPIHAIQGAAQVSPLRGTSVTTTGVVTALRSNGFYLQDPAPDTDPATSEAIFVFTSSRPTAAVGDGVRVTGAVQEFRPGGATSGNLTTTELSSPTVSALSTGNPLPATTVVGTGGRVPPGEVVENDSAADVESGNTFDPSDDGLDFWESLEGMRVEIDDAVAVGPTQVAFGETPVVSDGTATGRTPRGGVILRPGDANPERVILDDAITPLPTVNTGDRYSGPVVGVLDYNFGNFFLEVTQPVTTVPGGLAKESTTPAAAGQLAVATFNVENLDPSDGADKFNRLAGVVVDNLKSPDIIGVEEVQDNNGAANDGITDATTTLNTLVAAIQAAGGPTYSYREIDPVDDQDGGEPGGNIRVVFLYRTDRGLTFVDRPGGTATTADSVTATGDLAFSPGRIEPADPAFDSSRKPLAGQFLFNGQKVFVITNHFNSKGGDDPLMGRFQPPVRSSETQRHRQAEIVRDFTRSILAADPNADVVVLGDLNDFQFSDTLALLKATPLHDLIETLPANEQYSYDFEGNSQTLDHILLSDSLFAQPYAYDIVHVNAEFADQVSDHDPQVARLSVRPPNQAPTVAAGGPKTVAEGASLNLSAVGADPEIDPLTYAWDLNGDGTYETAGQSVTFTGADGPSSVTVGVRVTDPSGATGTDTAAIAVTNVAPRATFETPAGPLYDGDPFTLRLTGPNDPSAADTAAGFEYAFDCGSGYGAFSGSPSRSCGAAGPATLSVHGKIRDRDGGVREYDGTVDVGSKYDRVCALARRTSSSPAVARVICAALATAEKQAALGHRGLERGALAVAEAAVRVSTGRAFTRAEAAELIRAIRAL